MGDTLERTGIHTKVNEKYRISSVYRGFETYEGIFRGWETILWRKRDDGKEEIADITAPKGNAQDVVEQHAAIFYRIHSNGGEWRNSNTVGDK